MTMTANSVLYAFGSGRTSTTKADRRMNRFADRHFRIGEHVIVRPGRRVPVTLGYLAGHVDVVVENIKRGALRLQSSADSFVDPKELRSLLRGAGLLVGGPGEGEEGNEETTNPGEGVSEPEANESQSEPEPEQEDTQSEPEPEPEPEQQQESSSESMDEQPGLADNESGMGSAEMAAAMPALPDGWKTRNKRALLDLCKERGVAATNTLSNRDIIALLEGAS